VPPPAATGPAPPAQEHQGVTYRSPLADVADMMWSLGQVATSAADERDPSGSEGLGELAAAWEQRNRSAFLAGYLGVPGISTLLPRSRDAVRVLVAALELERASRVTL
jgi:predicted trehalose synthase